MRGWPRTGVPRALRDFGDFCAMSARLSTAAGVPDYTWFWWKLRPHPRMGTVEIRALDAQAALGDLAALVALAHCLARHEAEADPAPEPPAEILEEGIFRAARWGVEAELPDAGGRLRPLRAVLAETLELVGDRAAELGCTEELAGLERLVASGGGAGRQRAAHAIGGMGTLLRETAAVTAAP